MTSSAINNDEVRTRERKRISPKKAVKREEEKKRKQERERESWRAFLVTFRLSELPPSYHHPPLLPLPFATPSSGKPVASLPALTPLRNFFHGKFVLPSSGLPRETKFPRRFSLRAEFPRVIQENLVPTLGMFIFPVSEDLRLRL